MRRALSRGADSAAHLDGNSHGVDYAFHDAKIVGLAGAGAVEVHDVDTAGSEALPAEGDFDRVVGVHGLLGVVSLVEADALSVYKVYGGD